MLAFFLNSAILFSVREIKNNMKNEMKTVKFLNVTFKVNRHPDYTGNHELAQVNRVHTTFSLGTTEQDMIDEFHAELVNIDVNGKTWTKGEMIQVESIDNCFEDRAETWAK